MNAKRQDKQPNRPEGSMKGPFLTSAIFHGLIFIVALVGLPFVKQEPLILAPVSVELVDISDLTKAKKPPPKKVEPIEKPKEPEPPKPPPEELEKPEPVPEAVPPPKPKEEPKKEPEKPKEKPKPKPKEKPKEKPKRTMDDLLKDMTPPEKEQAEQPNEPDVPQNQIPDFSKELTRSELESLNYGVGRCWQIDAGVRYAEKYKPKLRVYVDQGMNVTQVEPLEPLRLSTDKTYRAVYQKARNALLNQTCKKLELPAKKYGGKYFDLTFDPSSMLGY